MKVPDSAIIKQLQEEVKALRKKNHKVCTKAKVIEVIIKIFISRIIVLRKLIRFFIYFHTQKILIAWFF